MIGWCAGALLALLAARTALAEEARPGATPKASKQSLEQVERKIRETEGEAKSLEAKKSGVLGEIESFDREADRHERRLGDLAREIQSEEEKRESAKEREAALDRDLARLRAELLARARGLYRLTRRGLSSVVFEARGDLTDRLRGQRALEAILARDRKLLAEIRTNRADAEAARLAAADAAKALAVRRREAEGELGAVRARRQEKKALVASLKTESARRAQLVEELRGAAERLRALIEKQEAAPPPARSRPLPRATSKMRAPLPGPPGEFVRARGGIEIAAAEGTPIEAVADGRVVFADWLAGYGKMVIVDHGRRLYSVYGYASELAVRQGELVSAGDPIAKVGSTGAASRPSLYFEVREHGIPQDPRGYVPSLAASRSRGGGAR